MNRNSLAISMAVLLSMLLVIGIAVYFLYRDVDVERNALPDVLSQGTEVSVAEEIASPAQKETVRSEQVVKETVSEESAAKEDVAGVSVNYSVVVPEGPFEVKNSKTRRINQFSQNEDKSLVLKDNGKSLWVASFKSPICGRAANVDYYANGNLQIAFCAGSKLYLIDRLGRFVKGFPVELGKQVVLGPDVYDFNRQRRYNILVLHNDNTVEMYNLKGQKPSDWKKITAKEAILGLPESVSVGGKTFWIVRTSGETLVFPFYGGKPVLDLSGDGRISNTSKVTVVNGTSIAVKLVDGSEKIFKIR